MSILTKTNTIAKIETFVGAEISSTYRTVVLKFGASRPCIEAQPTLRII